MILADVSGSLAPSWPVVKSGTAVMSSYGHLAAPARARMMCKSALGCVRLAENFLSRRWGGCVRRLQAQFAAKTGPRLKCDRGAIKKRD